MQKRVLDFINLKNTSRSKNSFRIMYGGGTKNEKTVFLHLVWGWQKKVWRCRKRESQWDWDRKLKLGLVLILLRKHGNDLGVSFCTFVHFFLDLLPFFLHHHKISKFTFDIFYYFFNFKINSETFKIIKFES